MAQDIEEFLRMAAARKKQQAQQNQPSAQPAESTPAQELPPQRLTPQDSEPDVYILDDQDVVDPYQQHQRLQPSIKTNVSTEDIAEQTSHLGERVHNRQEAVESRVSKKFDHSLGHLKKEDIEAPELVDHGRGLEKKPNISTVLQMIRSPNSLKQAIILKEIFDRPKF